MKKKLVVIFLLLFLCNINFIKAETNAYLTRTTYDNVYFVENGLPEYYMSDIQFHLSFNDKTAFCLDPTLQIKGYNYIETDLSKSSYDKETLNYLNKLIYYGYDYINHGTPKYYMATQALIWGKLKPYSIQFYTEQYGFGERINVDNEINEILFLVNNHDKVPYFSNKSYNYNLISNLEFQDNLLNNFEITSSNYNDIKIENNKLKINNLNGFIGRINIELKKKTYRNDEAKYYYLDGSQPMMTGGKLDDLIINLSVNITGAKIKLNKLDSGSNLPIKNSNIVFNIRNIDTNEYVYLNGSKDLKINNDGYLITDYLPSGTYEIKEIRTESGYKLDNNSKIIELNENTSLNNGILEVNFYNEKELGKLEIIKIDSSSKNKIENVEFGLYANENIVTKDGVIHYKKGQTISSEKTDKNGKIVFDNLVLGNYCIKEISTLNDYKLNTEEHCFNLYENKSINITIQNELKKGLVEIKKYGEEFNFLENKYDLKLLENIEFEIFAGNDIITSDGTIHYKKDEIIDTKKTDKKGNIIFDNLVLGNYCIREKYTNNNYIRNDKEYCFNLYDNINQNVEVYNYLKKVNLKINKLDNDSKLNIKNSNVVFNLKNINTNEYIYLNNEKDLKLNEEGFLIINDLPYGTYELEEIKTDDAYKLNNIKQIIKINDTINLNDNILEINFYNEKKLGKIEVKKYGEKFNYINKEYNFKHLENMEFELFANDDIVTSDGTVHYKKDEIIDNKKTDKNGIIVFDNLVLGNYCIREKYTNNNYIKNDKEYCFNLYDDINQNIEIYNYLKKANLKINKLDNDSKLNIKNSAVVFNLKNADTNEYIYLNNEKDLKVNKTGFLIINDLPYGIYELEEIKTDEEYKLNNQKEIIEINDSTNLNNNLEINFYNEKELGKIEITKVDNISKSTIENVEFEIYSKEDIVTKDGVVHYKKGKTISTKKTDKNGIIVFDNLILGNYCIKEVNVPKDYKLNTDEYCFDLYEDKINNITIENELKKGQIEIKKYGEEFNYINKEYSFNSLQNIEFEISASNDIVTSDGIIHYKKDKIIDNKRTDKNGNIVFDNLVLGNYCIREKNIDEKYINNDKEYCFDLYNNNDSKIEVYNYLKKSNLRIIKVDSLNNKPLDNVEFEIFHNEQSLGKYITNKDGIIEISNLPVSIYEIKELKSKEGYMLTEESYTIDLNLNEGIVIENDKIINIPNAMKNDYTNVLVSTIYIIGIVLFIYEKQENT